MLTEPGGTTAVWHYGICSIVLSVLHWQVINNRHENHLQVGYHWLTSVQSVGSSYLVLISYQPHGDNENSCFWSINIKESHAYCGTEKSSALPWNHLSWTAFSRSFTLLGLILPKPKELLFPFNPLSLSACVFICVLPPGKGRPNNSRTCCDFTQPAVCFPIKSWWNGPLKEHLDQKENPDLIPKWLKWRKESQHQRCAPSSLCLRWYGLSFWGQTNKEEERTRYLPFGDAGASQQRLAARKKNTDDLKKVSCFL